MGNILLQLVVTRRRGYNEISYSLFYLYFFRNKPLSQCYIMDINSLPEKWISLPDLPLPTVSLSRTTDKILLRLTFLWY
jgi:hypothetical protein